MNEVINLLNEHRSFRAYKDEPVSREQLDTIVKSAMAAANWINGQQVTVIEVQDKARKEKLMELVGNQKHVNEAPVFLIFCLDFYRAKVAAEKNNVTLEVTDSVESLLTGSTDVGIALGNAITAAESFGLGTVPIGGIRRNPQDVIDLLGLPEYVFPISGLVVGHPNEEVQLKPRLPLEAVHHKEHYNKELKEFIDQYDDTYVKYMLEKSNGAQSSQWTSHIANFYSERYKVFANNVVPALKNQGFKLEEQLTSD